MSGEDKVGKMMSRVELVGEVEDYEELLDNLRTSYTSEEVDFILKVLVKENNFEESAISPRNQKVTLNDESSILKEYGKMRIN